jgi:hypothetical protein
MIAVEVCAIIFEENSRAFRKTKERNSNISNVDDFGRILSSGIYHLIFRYKSADASEECGASMEEVASVTSV